VRNTIKKMKAVRIAGLVLCIAALCSLCVAVESDVYRLLSVSVSAKMILVAQPASKAKFLLDASAAKLTLDEKPTEIKNLSDYSVIHVKFEERKFDKDGISLDGVASEIRILTPENPPRGK
jgi:hypothetical protein